jgi:hypothetical protein
MTTRRGSVNVLPSTTMLLFVLHCLTRAYLEPTGPKLAGVLHTTPPGH